ncbi:MAG: 50S ribosomal protein L13 [Gammaproteobacteria bacterium]|nr:50S ribosomal protein L13 [Gammaproteobacteria bacterium]MCY4200312.1 50S ribosomal protein L13 [Gammaproteobacteria bacterium]MCY4278561.1 50S ribosomal protein L13 [Gammaproteobacteria bacterium]MCY4323164.1 50S ribosomal protein L13 [Gammaproteobacteria bacterium]
MTTLSTRPADVTTQWRLVDASDCVLGRLASRIATVLRGKDKPEYTPHVDVGDFVIVVNADKVRVTGNKHEDKMYHRHSGYPGGIKSMSFRSMQERVPERIIELAVKGMLPRNPLGRQMARKLKVYAGPAHPHQAQQPKPMEI